MMLAIITALMVQPLPTTLDESGVAAFEVCLETHPPEAGGVACFDIDAAVREMQTCLDAAWGSSPYQDCVDVQEFSCGEVLHASGVQTALLLRYCSRRNLAVLEALSANQWLAAASALSPEERTQLRLAFDLSARHAASVEANETEPAHRYIARSAHLGLWVRIMDAAIRRSRDAARPSVI